MLHLTHSVRPEIVSFAGPHQFSLPLLIEAGHDLVLRSTDAGKIAITRFQIGKDEERQMVEPVVADVIRAMAALGASYPDVVHALQQAKEKRLLSCRLEVDAVPESGRIYTPGHPSGETDQLADSSVGTGLPINNPLPDLFVKRPSGKSGGEEAVDETEFDAEKTESAGTTKRRFWDRMKR